MTNEAPSGGGVPEGQWKPRIWAMHCPFRKSGSPVLGTFGATTRAVVIIPMETWTRLCNETPGLNREFEVGTYE